MKTGNSVIDDDLYTDEVEVVERIEFHRKIHSGLNQANGDETTLDLFETNTTAIQTTKSHVNVQRQLHQAGYREGKAKAEEITHQEGFDTGFSLGMKIGQIVGVFVAKMIQFLKENHVEDEPKDTAYKLIYSLTHEGPECQFEKKFFDQLKPFLTLFPEEIQQDFHNLQVSLTELNSSDN
jgi:hypothetical protein